MRHDAVPSTDRITDVYDALRKLAARRLADERPGHTLQATALVHDVYLRLADDGADRWADTAHFYHAAAEAMRRVLVDHARARSADKRDAGLPRVPLTEVMAVATLAERADPDDVLALDAAVTRLATISADAAAVVRLRFYAGLSVDQTADALATSPRTVARQWVYARAWLRKTLAPAG